jgi:hypothetical protein
MSIFNNHSAEILIVLFFCITYFFSVLEKLINWKETVAYYKTHFKKTILKNIIPLLLIIVILLEVLALLTLCAGLYFIVTQNDFLITKIALQISAFTLLLFLIGQRLAKDYQGATSIVVYFILNIFGIYLLT